MKNVIGKYLVSGIILALVALPAVASAGVVSLPGDPLSTVSGEYTGWVATAQHYAQYIYYALFIFEVIAVAITTLLFRENLGEFFASVGFKVLLGGIFFWFIANGPTLATKVIQMFTTAGQTQFNGGDPTTVVVGFLASAAAFFTAANNAHLATMADMVPWMTPDICLWITFGEGYCPVAIISVTQTEHQSFILIAQGIGLMMVMGSIGILLQFYIVTIESYLVMSVGILMVGFGGTRWTSGFSQGYFSYMVNVGVKLMVTYIILGVAEKGLIPIVAGAAATVLASAFSLYGAGDAVIIGLAAISAVYVLLTLGLIWTIPAFTAALLSGQSQSSGFAILSQAMGSFAGAAQAFAQFGAAKGSAADAASNRQAMHDVQAHTAGAGGANNASALTAQTMSSGRNVDSQLASAGGGALNGIGVGTSGTAGTLNITSVNGPQLAAGGVAGSVPFNPTTGMAYSGIGGGNGASSQSLYRSSPDDIRAMSSGEFQERMQSTDWSRLNDKQQEAIMEYHPQEAQQSFADRAQRDDQNAALNTAYGLNGLTQAAPREIGQPSAVQVRISSPDRL